MIRPSLLDQIRAMAMARDYCRLVGADPDAMVAGAITDVAGRSYWVRKQRWRWYSDIARPQDDAEGSARDDGTT